ncbi:alpha/beta fold hydrolase [Nonomuraea rhodomycinica]|uniref:Alpha/beta fold hydrolase n=1 Tax=Nonomuraea rhodomycinica TaxID=1712872 RepID=A0A7Y6IK58_9ACTN|nr:alpha/beta fold hydrolase [Nonomuraea rhodomycinica]NUW39642.1 alpha/beta fold hydrolase [Nonomuraea rhodomycinica]
MTTRVIANGEVSLWSEDFGDPAAPPLLLIAGGNLSAKSWPDAFVALLAEKGHHVIRYDHRDTGRSTATGFQAFQERPYGFDELVSDALAVLDGWEVPAAHVVGMSLGHTIGQLLAIDHPDRLLSLTLMLGGALDVDFDANIERAMSGAPSADGLPLPTRRFLDVITLMSEPVDGPEAELERRVEKWRLLNGEDLPFDADEFRRGELRAVAHAGTFQEPINHHMIPQPPVSRGAELAGVRVPTLAIQAMRDPAAPPPHARHVADLIPGARVVELAEMGHALASAVHEPLAAAISSHTLRTPHRVTT